MQPCGALIREPVVHVAVVNSQPLYEFLAVAAASNHFFEIAGQKEQKPNRPKQIIDQPDHRLRTPDCGLASEIALQLRHMFSAELRARTSY